MADWTITTLENCTEILGDGLHGTPKYSENGEYAFVNGNNLVDGEIVIKKDTKKVDVSQYEKYKKTLTDRTILVSINGTLGNVGMYNSEKIVLGKSACYFNVKNSVDKDFIYYVVSSPAFKQYLESNATGTTIKNISLKQMRGYLFSIPPIKEQKQISSILRKIDQKIKNNKMINNNLLEQAQLLHSQLCESANVERLSTLIDVIETGSRPKGGALSTGIPSIGAEKIEQFGIYNYSSEKYISEEYFNKLKRGVVQSGDVFLYKDGAYTGKSSMTLNGFPHTKCAVNEHVFILRTKDKYAQSFLYLTLRNQEIHTKIYNLACGKAAQPGLNQQELLSVEIKLPSISEINEFEQSVKPLMEIIALKAQESKKLVELRDSILPRLMSGELDVSTLNI